MSVLRTLATIARTSAEHSPVAEQRRALAMMQALFGQNVDRVVPLPSGGAIRVKIGTPSAATPRTVEWDVEGFPPFIQTLIEAGYRGADLAKLTKHERAAFAQEGMRAAQRAVLDDMGARNPIEGLFPSGSYRFEGIPDARSPTLRRGRAGNARNDIYRRMMARGGNPDYYPQDMGDGVLMIRRRNPFRHEAGVLGALAGMVAGADVTADADRMDAARGSFGGALTPRVYEGMPW